ncbi:NUDIX domain-containing protein [Ramlibacter sp. AW1]|uniref:NUDIX domain-containing protein n=1 Tax=Ramlibacter aurantiacus TaxID=2801330 RepID=A0A936ZL61_9BURK|nr:NUDIX domain-containing protein [Ramlibacter aurantiacus]MBL0422907.1 NUDIX domain-containing protein [Ramlibacter aurantiacus]
MASVISCGVLIVNERDELLLAHVTGQRQWDIPKGLPDASETPRQAAVREVLEETGITLRADELEDLGVFAYLPRKALHLFRAARGSAMLELSTCRCSSQFRTRWGKTLPEVDAFRWARREEIGELCIPRLAQVLRQAWPPSG